MPEDWGQRLCLRDWENLCAAHAGLGLPRSAPVWLHRAVCPTAPMCASALSSLQTQPSGPSGVSAPAGPQMAQAVPENRRAVDQGIEQQQRRQRDVCETFPRGLWRNSDGCVLESRSGDDGEDAPSVPRD